MTVNAPRSRNKNCKYAEVTAVDNVDRELGSRLMNTAPANLNKSEKGPNIAKASSKISAGIGKS